MNANYVPTERAVSEDFTPNLAQRVLDSERFRAILDSERTSMRMLGIAVVVAYANGSAALEEIKGRIGK